MQDGKTHLKQPARIVCRNKTTKVSENPFLTGWVQMEAAIDKAGETSTEVI
jgi:hypothetical protein